MTATLLILPGAIFRIEFMIVFGRNWRGKIFQWRRYFAKPFVRYRSKHAAVKIYTRREQKAARTTKKVEGSESAENTRTFLTGVLARNWLDHANHSRHLGVFLGKSDPVCVRANLATAVSVSPWYEQHYCRFSVGDSGRTDHDCWLSVKYKVLQALCAHNRQIMQQESSWSASQRMRMNSTPIRRASPAFNPLLSVSISVVS